MLFEKNCLNCGKKYETKQRCSAYCSKECKTKYIGKFLHVNLKRKCFVCGKWFKVIKNSMYCKTCRDKNLGVHGISKNALCQKVKCKTCKKLFYRNRISQVYCSSICRSKFRNIFRNKRWNSLYHRKKTCPECGAVFKTNNIGRIYCTRECKGKHNVRARIIREKKKNSEWFRKKNTYRMKQYNDRKERGVCVDCGGEKEPECKSVRCSFCFDRDVMRRTYR